MLKGLDDTKTEMKYIEAALEEMKTYTSEQLEDIEKTKTFYFFGWPLRMPDEDKWIYTTKEGFQHQLDKFDVRAGLLYHITFKSGRLDLAKIGVFKTWDSVYGGKVEEDE
jgi:hypothetical protein